MGTQDHPRKLEEEKVEDIHDVVVPGAGKGL
jgi:hypothetical protein